MGNSFFKAKTWVLKKNMIYSLCGTLNSVSKSRHNGLRTIRKAKITLNVIKASALVLNPPNGIEYKMLLLT